MMTLSNKFEVKTAKMKRLFRMLAYYKRHLGMKGATVYILSKFHIFKGDFIEYQYENYYKKLDLDDKDVLMHEIFERYYAMTGRAPEYVTHPISFNDWIQWIKINEIDETKTLLADKYLMRNWVKANIGEQYLVPLLGVWDSFDEIDFDRLPDSFVLKCNHGSGMNLIVRDKGKVNWEEQKKKFDKWMDTDFSYFFCEMQYHNIPRKIVAEELLVDEDGKIPKDYKVFVFNGKVKMIQVDIDRFGKEHFRNLYTPAWEYIDASILYPSKKSYHVERPGCLDEMIRISEELGADFRHVRADLYVVEDQVYVGELTFTHGNGTEKFTPENFGEKVGEWMVLYDVENTRDIDTRAKFGGMIRYRYCCIHRNRIETAFHKLAA